MNVNKLKSLAKDFFGHQDQVIHNLNFELLKQKHEGKFLYEFQYFWQFSPIDEAVLKALHSYQKGEVFLSFFKVFYIYYGSPNACNPTKIINEKYYDLVLQFLLEYDPDLLIKAIKKGKAFTKQPYLSSFAPLRDHTNHTIKTFYQLIKKLGDDYLRTKNEITCLVGEVASYKTHEILFYLCEAACNPKIQLNCALNAFNHLIPQIKNKTNQSFKPTERVDNEQLRKLCNQLIRITIYNDSFKSDCIQVLCYDDNAIVSLNKKNEIDIKYKNYKKHQIWRKNGAKYQTIEDYYGHKAQFVAIKQNRNTPSYIKRIISTDYIKDFGLKEYDLGGFNIEHVIDTFYIFMHINKWKDNVLTIDSRGNWVQYLIDLTKNTIDKTTAEKIIDWLTYKKGYFHFGQKIFIEIENYLILPGQFLGQLNCHVPFINRIYNTKTDGKIKPSVATNQAKVLRDLFKEKIPNATFIIDRPLPDNSGEIDLAIYDGQTILILELKGSAIRVNLQERDNLKKTTLNKANQQLKNIKEKLQNKDAYNWLLEKLNINKETKINIEYAIISTSFEWDDLTNFKFPKYTYFTLLNLLRNDRHFFCLEATFEFMDITNVDKSKLKSDESIKKTAYRKAGLFADQYFYYDKLNLKTFLQLLKEGVVWDFLDR